jgi:hypothetical protein
MDTIFNTVYQALLWLSAATGLSYKEVNVVLYFFLLPLVFIFLVAYIMKTWKLFFCALVASIAFLLWIPDFPSFCNMLFDLSVSFLNGFSMLGWNYTQASVIICVILPALALLFLILLMIAGKRRPHKTPEN